MVDLQPLADAVTGMRVTPPMPDWAVPVVDPYEQAAPTPARDDSSGWSAFITYTNEAGVQSKRRIVCRRIEGYGRAETISGYCIETSAYKRFRVDRIAELICLDTGECLEASKHFESLRLFGALHISDKALADLSSILVFMAKCDGDFHPLEAHQITMSIEKYVLRYGGDERLLDTAMRNARRLAPDDVDFMRAIHRVRKHPQSKEVARLILESVNNVNGADGVYRDEEIEWGSKVGAALKAMAYS